MPRVNLIQVRRDTAANWTSANPTLAAGETGFETDTLLTKVGNGSTAWTGLSYTSSTVADGSVTTAKLASTASTTFVGGKRIIVQTTTPTAPAGGFGVGDVWISYTA
jgi:hypothetical protein